MTLKFNLTEVGIVKAHQIIDGKRKMQDYEIVLVISYYCALIRMKITKQMNKKELLIVEGQIRKAREIIEQKRFSTKKIDKIMVNNLKV
jgi:hypothetical protein